MSDQSRTATTPVSNPTNSIPGSESVHAFPATRPTAELPATTSPAQVPATLPKGRHVRIRKTEPTLMALRAVQPPYLARRLASLLALLFVMLPFALLFVPWQQNISGGGTVVALDPIYRPQDIEAAIDGQIRKWYAVEGTHIKKGQPIVEVADNDPLYTDKLEAMKMAIQAKLDAANERRATFELRITALREAQELTVKAAESEIKMAQQRIAAAMQKRAAAEADMQTSKLLYDRQVALESKGLDTRQNRELAQLRYQTAFNRFQEATADLESANKDLEAREARRDEIKPRVQSEIETANAGLRTAEGDIATANEQLTSMEVNIARQATQVVKAPTDGTVFRIIANVQETGQIKRGDPLLTFVPDIPPDAKRVVQIWLDGNDIPLVQPGRHTRLMFEGWPGVQFVGWPSVAVGSFGGKVMMVDSTDNGMGKFRVLVEPDDPNGWPSPEHLRQGVRAKGFVLLDQVPLGWELWRRANGFPPTVADGEAAKEIKVKRPKT